MPRLSFAWVYPLPLVGLVLASAVLVLMSCVESTPASTPTPSLVRENRAGLNAPSGTGGSGREGRGSRGALTAMATDRRSEAPPIPVEAAAVRIGTIPRLLRATGRLVSRHHIKVTAGVTGQLLDVLVREGDRVEKNTALALFDAVTFKSAHKEAEINANQRQSDWDRAKLARIKAEADLKRALDVISRGGAGGEEIFSQEQRDNLDHAVKLAVIEEQRAALEFSRARETVERAVRDVNLCVVKAPISGVVTRRSVEPFDRVNLGTELFQLLDPTQLEIRLGITEGEAANVMPRQAAVVVSRSRPVFLYPAEIEAVAPSVDVDRGLVDVRVRVSPSWPMVQGVTLVGQTQRVWRLAAGPIPGLAPILPVGCLPTAPPLKPGTFVTVEIATAIHEAAILVPKEALLYERDVPYVFRVTSENKAEQVRLQLRADFATQDAIEVESGLSPGDRVVIRQADLKDGSVVQVVRMVPY